MRILKKIVTIVAALSSFSLHAGQIALTFDDAPLSGNSLIDGKEITEKIINALKSRDISDALFFVTTSNIKNEANT